MSNMTKFEENIVKETKTSSPFRKKGISAVIRENQQTIASLDPLTRENRLGLVCDDSGSMSGQTIKDAHSAVAAFVQICKPQETSICIYPLNAQPKSLICNYDLLVFFWNSVGATGGTPLYTKLTELLEKEPVTRIVVFSDGEPTDGSILLKEQLEEDIFDISSSSQKKINLAKTFVEKTKEKKVPVDTIFIGSVEDSQGYRELKTLAELTGGIFVWFKDSKSLTSGLKYLAPAYRGLLANPEIKEKIQRGEKI